MNWPAVSAQGMAGSASGTHLSDEHWVQVAEHVNGVGT